EYDLLAAVGEADAAERLAAGIERVHEVADGAQGAALAGEVRERHFAQEVVRALGAAPLAGDAVLARPELALRAADLELVALRSDHVAVNAVSELHVGGGNPRIDGQPVAVPVRVRREHGPLDELDGGVAGEVEEQVRRVG